MRRRPMSEKKFLRVKKASQSDWQKGVDVLARELEKYVLATIIAAKNAGAAIHDVRLTEPFGREDALGWDIVITDVNDASHPLQVKSSRVGAMEFRRYGDKKGMRPVAVIVPRLNDTPQQILDKVGKVMPFLWGFKLEKGRKHE